MVSVNPLTREIYLKIVYYGPGLGGKTTTLQYIHDTTDPQHRGKMVSLATPVERTLYFDYLPVRLPEIGGYALKLQLFTVPGQIHFNATRKLVLSNVDGVVFVADSQRSRLEANLESFDNLLFNLTDYKVDVEIFPIVLHYNKRDLTDIAPLSVLESDLNRKGRPSLGTCALDGTNVYEGLELITKEVLRSLKRKGMSSKKVQQIETAIPPDKASPFKVEKQKKQNPEKAINPIQGRLPLEDAVSKIADRSFSETSGPIAVSSQPAAVLQVAPESDTSQPSMERPTIPAPFALSEKVVSEQSRSQLTKSLRNVPSVSLAPSRFTFVPIWPEPARKRGMEIETAVCERRYLDAIRLILAELDLIIAIHRQGREMRSVETLLALFGLDSIEYQEIAALAISPSPDITLRSVLNAYLFLLQVIDKSR